MNDWIAMAINIGYVLLAGRIIKFLNLTSLKWGWTENFATMFLASIFLQIGLLLFDIPVGFFGFNNPVRIADMKARWWVTPGVFLTPLLLSLSCKTSLESFRSENFRLREALKILLGSILWGGGFVALFIAIRIGRSDVDRESQQILLDYWWAIWLVIGLLHLFLSALIKAACQLFAWKKKIEQQANAPDMDGL